MTFATCAHTRLDRRHLGVDPGEGRFADVSLERCLTCGRQWLLYRFELEAFSRSGRWYRGEITTEAAETATPETASALLESLPAYEAGGSYYDGVVRTRRGPLL